jgi:hypothetical protein
MHEERLNKDVTFVMCVVGYTLLGLLTKIKDYLRAHQSQHLGNKHGLLQTEVSCYGVRMCVCAHTHMVPGFLSAAGTWFHNSIQPNKFQNRERHKPSTLNSLRPAAI